METLGLDLSSAIRLFFTQITIQQTLPFPLPQLRVPSKKTLKIVADALKDERIGPFTNAEAVIRSLHAKH